MRRAIEPTGVFLDDWGFIPARATRSPTALAETEAVALFPARGAAPACFDTWLGVTGALHDDAVLARCHAFARGRRAEDLALVYVHRGHGPRFRTPVLLGLLAAIPRFGSVQSLRAAGHDLPLEALLLAIGSLGGARFCLVLNDTVERLALSGDADANTPGVSHLSLSCDGGRNRLSRIAVDEAETNPARPLACPIAVSDAFGRKAVLTLTEVHHDFD